MAQAVWEYSGIHHYWQQLLQQHRAWCIHQLPDFCCSQVLAKALEVWNLSLQPLDAPDMRVSAEHPEQEDAFICNLQVCAPSNVHLFA